MIYENIDQVVKDLRFIAKQEGEREHNEINVGHTLHVAAFLIKILYETTCDQKEIIEKLSNKTREDEKSRWVKSIPIFGDGEGKIHCRKCGNVVKTETDFCPYCGRAMTDRGVNILERRTL